MLAVHFGVEVNYLKLHARLTNKFDTFNVEANEGIIRVSNETINQI